MKTLISKIKAWRQKHFILPSEVQAAVKETQSDLYRSAIGALVQSKIKVRRRIYTMEIQIDRSVFDCGLSDQVIAMNIAIELQQRIMARHQDELRREQK